jgi:branched-chain amino acid transport system permease protein
MPADVSRQRARRAAVSPWMWACYALALVLAPQLWRSGFALTLLSQMGIAIIICLSYNLLLGEGGMLSFGHAVYSGLGAYAAIHALNRISAGAWGLPVALVPLVGGLAGLACAALLGYVSTRRAGTTFAMITLGVGELVAALALMLPEFSGGEGGITANRVVGAPVLGISWGPQIELYYLIALYALLCTAALYAWTRTPLGCLLNAVRDNPLRLAFLGYGARQVRYLAFMTAGLFAGIGGGLSALNFEIVTPEVLGTQRSGVYLLFVFLGGAGFFWGPVLGAVLMVLALVWLSALTPAWLLYVGLLFVLVVMAAPGGLAGWLTVGLPGRRRPAEPGRRPTPTLAALAQAASAGLAALALVALIEMSYRLRLESGVAEPLWFGGLALDPHRPVAWLGATAALLAGLGLLLLMRLGIARRAAAAEGASSAAAQAVLCGQGRSPRP